MDSPPPPPDPTVGIDGLVVRGDDDPPEPVQPWYRRALRLIRDFAIGLAGLGVVWVAVGWWRAPALPELAPGFSLVSLDGQTISLAELRGKTVVLNFWATWCGPCRMEVPGLADFARTHPDIPVLGIAVDGTPEQLRIAADQLGITYPVLAADAATRKAYAVTTLPTTVVVGPDGAVRAAHAGIMFEPHLVWLTR